MIRKSNSKNDLQSIVLMKNDNNLMLIFLWLSTIAEIYRL